jgi:hypothetical protein
VLVTSRSILPGLEADERISLDILSPDEAAAMLAGVIRADGAAAEPHAVAEVARLCGRLPLALRIAGQLLAAHPVWPVERLARMLAGEQDRLAEAYLVTEEALGRFVMHDLLRLFARAICQQADSPADRDTAEARPVSHYLELARALDACVDPQLRQEAAQDGLPLPSVRKALALFQTERPSLLAVVGLAAQHGWDEQVFRLSESMGTR